MTTHYVRMGQMITRIADGARIPTDEGNDDYVRYLREIAENANDPTYLIDGYDPTVALADVQAAALAEVDAEAERIRLRYITPGFGQAQVYAAKMEQALSYQAATAAEKRDLTKWPMIESEVVATELPAASAAAQIIAANRTWLIAAAKIERIRLSCKRQIAAATTHLQAAAARDDALAQLRAAAKK